MKRNYVWRIRFEWYRREGFLPNALTRKEARERVQFLRRYHYHAEVKFTIFKEFV